MGSYTAGIPPSLKISLER